MAHKHPRRVHSYKLIQKKNLRTNVVMLQAMNANSQQNVCVCESLFVFVGLSIVLSGIKYIFASEKMELLCSFVVLLLINERWRNTM